MSTPPNKSTLSTYASTTNNKAQAGAVAVAGAIGTTLARGAASWINEANKTIQQHLPAARSATQYYSYDAKRTSEKTYRGAKKTLRGVAGGAVKVSNWMGLDLSLPEDDDDDNNHNRINNNNRDSPIPFDAAIEVGEGNLVPGEEECHYTPQPTGFAGQVEVTRVQLQMSPSLVVLDQNSKNKNQTNTPGSNYNPQNLLSSASCAENMNAGSQTAAVLSLCLLGPGGSPGFAIFRVDCSDVFEEVVELHLSELESLGPVKSVCVAEVLSYPKVSSSSTFSSSSYDNNSSSNTNQRNINVLNPLPTATKIAVVLTERCILQYNIAMKKVVAFQQLSFEASDLKLCSNYALVSHSGFGQISVLSLAASSSKSSSSGSSSSSSSSSSSVVFAFDELDVILPEGDETALSDRWLAYVGSGSEGSRASTRLLSYAEKTTAENISKHIHTGLKAVGGFLGSAVSKALQATGVSSGSNNENLSADERMMILAQQQEREMNSNNNASGGGKDDYIFNPSTVGAIPDKSDKPIGTVVIRDLATRTDIAAFVAHENPIQKMTFDSTGTILATCAVDGKHIHVFRVCPKGSATATATVSSAAAFQRLPRLPSQSAGATSSMFGLFGGNSNNNNRNNNNSADNNSTENIDNMMNTNSSSPNQTPISSPTTTNQPHFNNNSNNSSTSPSRTNNNNNNLSYPNTTIVFSHRINRGMSSGTVESLSFSQPWTWLACTTTIGTAHFFKLEMDRLTNVEENIVACESGMLPAANVHGADFRIRSAPSTIPPSPIVSFFPGEASTGAGEQTTACLVTKSSTVATSVVSSLNDKGVLLYERAAAHFAGSKMMMKNDASGSSASGQPRTLYRSGVVGADGNSKSGGKDGSSAAGTNNNSKKFMTAEACWMELLHRRTQPQFAPLYDGITVELLPEPEKKNSDEDEDEE